MKKLVFQITKVVLIFTPFITHSQIFNSNGATISVTAGGVLHCNGGITLSNNSNLINEGSVRTTKNASNILAGTFTNASASTSNGSGEYFIEQDWINDANFIADNSSVYLYGNSEQIITSTNGTVTEFNNLICQGNGTGIDRKKSLQNVDMRISSTGTLQLNNRELALETNNTFVLNPLNNAISNDQSFGNEGFISSLPPGFVIWSSNSINPYFFPVGSSDGVLRYRPVLIETKSADPNSYSVRFNNVPGDSHGFTLSQHDSEIETLNDLFYHSIEQELGVYNADVSISYLPSNDGDWSSIAQWDFGQSLWAPIAPTENSAVGNYSAIKKANWDFTNPAHPYVLVNLEDGLNIPNVFTPNQDGANDVYLVSGKGITEYNIVIVNRWGNVVFESNDINTPWDGTSNGTPCQDGVYFYIIKAKSLTQEYDKHGHITLTSN